MLQWVFVTEGLGMSRGLPVFCLDGRDVGHGRDYLWCSIRSNAPKSARTYTTLLGVVRSLQFESLEFNYPGTDKPVLRDINLRYGRSNGDLVGENGAGKSSS